MSPGVSVVLCARDAMQTLPAAIESILGQTYRSFELIVVDDGSTDDTAGIAEAYAGSDPRVRVLRRPHRGLTAALNAGLAAARGELIARQDADDVSMPTRLAEQVVYLRAHPRVLLLGCDFEVIDDAGRVLVTIRNSRRRALVRRLERHNQFVHGSLVFRRSVDGEPVRYDEYYRKSQDYDLALRLCERGEVAILARVLYRWRLSASGLAGSNVTFYGDRASVNHRRRLAGREELRGEPRPGNVADAPSAAAFQMALGHCYLAGYEIPAARRSFLRALRRWTAGGPHPLQCVAMLGVTLLPRWVVRHLRER